MISNIEAGSVKKKIQTVAQSKRVRKYMSIHRSNKIHKA